MTTEQLIRLLATAIADAKDQRANGWLDSEVEQQLGNEVSRIAEMLDGQVAT